MKTELTKEIQEEIKAKINSEIETYANSHYKYRSGIRNGIKIGAEFYAEKYLQEKSSKEKLVAIIKVIKAQHDLELCEDDWVTLWGFIGKPDGAK